MDIRKLLKFSLPAILLAVLGVGVVAFTPAILNNDPDEFIVSVIVEPRSTFIGENFAFTLSVRYPKDKYVVDPREIDARLEPFTLMGKPIIEARAGNIVVQYNLRCLENSSCAANKSYNISPLVIYYRDKSSLQINKLIVRFEPIYISPQIDPSGSNLSIRYPKEPVIRNNGIFFGAMVLVGIFILVFGLVGLYWVFFSRKPNKYSSNTILSLSDVFHRRFNELKIKLSHNGNPRFILAQISGIIADSLESKLQNDLGKDSLEKLIALKQVCERRAYQESEGEEPSAEEVSTLLNEAHALLVKASQGDQP